MKTKPKIGRPLKYGEPTHVVTIRIPESLWRGLAEPRSEEMVEAIRRYVNRRVR